MKKLLLLVVAVMASMSLAVAAPVCVPVLDVLTLNPTGCTIDGLLFSSFGVATALPNTKIGILSVADNPGSADIQFSVASSGLPVVAPSDILLSYMVSTVTGVPAIVGVDISHQGLKTNIQEIVCDSQGFQGSACKGVELANFAITGGYAEASFAAQSVIYIQKDIMFTDAGGTISHFTNSHHTPEPMSFVLMGTGLLGLGLIRKIRK